MISIGVFSCLFKTEKCEIRNDSKQIAHKFWYPLRQKHLQAKVFNQLSQKIKLQKADTCIFCFGFKPVNNEKNFIVL